MIWWAASALAGPAPSPLALGPLLATTSSPAAEGGALPAILTGEVREMGSGLPVEGASVEAGATSAVADERGRFALRLPPGEVELAVSAEGYRDASFRQLVPPEGVHAVYRLERLPGPEELVVYGARETDVPTVTLGAEELRRVPGSFGDPIRALQSLPSVSRGPELTGEIPARGAEAQNTAAYVDGVRVPFLFHFLVGRSVIDPDLIEGIEFLPGALPPRFGDTAQAVLQATIRSDRADPGLHGRVHADLLEGGGSLAANLSPDWTLRMGGRKAWVSAAIAVGAPVVRAARGLDDPEVREASIAVPYEDYLVKVVHTRGTPLTFTWIGARDALRRIPERVDRDGDGKVDPPPPSGLPYDEYLLLDNRFFRVEGRWEPEHAGHRWSTWVSAGRDRRQNLIPDLGMVGASGVQFARTEAWWTSVGHDGLHPLGAHADLRAGGDLIVQPSSITAVLEDPDTATTRATKVYAGPFAELPLTAGRLRLTPGFRASAHHLVEQWTLVPEPRLSARAGLSEVVAIVGYSGLLSQGPSIEQLGEGFTSREPEVIRAWQSTVGLESRWPSGLGLDLAVYRTRIGDLVLREERHVVELAPGANPGEPAPTHATVLTVPAFVRATGESWGVEGMLRIMPEGPRFGWLSAAVGRSLRTRGARTFSADTDIPVNVVGVFGFGLPRAWTLAARGQVASGLPFTPEVGVFLPEVDFHASYPGATNAARYPVYGRLDLRVDKTWVGKRATWTAYLDVYNATNRHNPLFSTYDWSFRELHVRAWVPVLPTFGLEVAY